MTNLEKWRYYLSNLESPDLFIDWTFYFLIGSTLQRRVWFGEGLAALYPNLYVVLIADPGVGKTMAAVQGLDCLESIMGKDDGDDKMKSLIPTAPDSTTLPALTKYLTDNCRRKFKVGGKLYVQYSLACVSEELGVLLREDTNDVVNFLLQAYDARQYKRITKNEGCDYIPNICLSFLAGTTPDYMGKRKTQELLEGGLIARTIFVAEDQPRFRRAKLTYSPEQKESFIEFRKYLHGLANVCGEVVFSSEAEEFFTHWYEKDFTMPNTSPKLKTYYGRKKVHTRKLSIIMSLSRSYDLIVEVQDVKDALELLERTEVKMDAAFGTIGKNPLIGGINRIKSFLRQEKVSTLSRLRLELGDDFMINEIDRCIETLVKTNQVTVKDNIIRLTVSSPP